MPEITDITEVYKDPDFQTLAPKDKRLAVQGLLAKDPDFQNVDPSTRPHVMNQIVGQFQNDAVPGDRTYSAAQVKQYLGIPYQYGGESCKGMDCSAFTQQLYKRNGVGALPRTANEQWKAKNGQQITDFAQLQPGDQLFFQGTNGHGPGEASHTGYYLGVNPETGKREFAHASSSAGAVVVSNLDSYPLQRLGAKRYPYIDNVVKQRLARGETPEGAPGANSPTSQTVASLTPQERDYAQKFLAPGHDAYEVLDRLKSSTPAEWPDLMKGYQGVGATVLTKLAKAWQAKQSPATYVQRAADELGVDPRTTRNVGIGPAAQGAKGEAASRRYMQDIQGTANPGHLVDRAIGAAVTGANIEDTPGLVGGLLNVGAPGASEEFAKIKGVQGGIAQGVAGFAEPSSIATMAVGGALTKNILKTLERKGATEAELKTAAKFLSRGTLAAFGAPAAKGAYERAQAGDIGGAIGELAAFAAPFALHPLVASAVARGEYALSKGAAVVLQDPSGRVIKAKIEDVGVQDGQGIVKARTPNGVVEARIPTPVEKGKPLQENNTPAAVRRGLPTSTQKALPPPPRVGFEAQADGSIAPKLGPIPDEAITNPNPATSVKGYKIPGRRPIPAPTEQPTYADAPLRPGMEPVSTPAPTDEGRLFTANDVFTGQALKTRAALQQHADEIAKFMKGSDPRVEQRDGQWGITFREPTQAPAPPSPVEKPIQAVDQLPTEASPRPPAPPSALARVEAAPPLVMTMPDTGMSPEQKQASRGYFAEARGFFADQLPEGGHHQVLSDLLKRPVASLKDVSPEEFKRAANLVQHYDTIKGAAAKRPSTPAPDINSYEAKRADLTARLKAAQAAGKSGIVQDLGKQLRALAMRNHAEQAQNTPNTEIVPAAPVPAKPVQAERRPIPAPSSFAPIEAKSKPARAGSASDALFERARAELNSEGQLRFLQEHKDAHDTLRGTVNKLNKAAAWVVDRPASPTEEAQKRQAQAYIERTTGKRVETKSQAWEAVKGHVDAQYRALDQQLHGHVDSLKGEHGTVSGVESREATSDTRHPTPAEPRRVPLSAHFTTEQQAYVKRSTVQEGWERTSDIHTREDVFQFRKRTVADFPNWNEQEAAKNPISIWVDEKGEIGPAGQKYAVNGHHRKANAEKFDVPVMRVRYIDAKNARAAREIGAIENLLDSPRNDAVDVAQFLRNTKLPQGDAGTFLRLHGVNTQSKVMREAVALTKLPDSVFETVYQYSEQVPSLKSLAAAIGEHFPANEQAAQFADVWQKIQQGQKVTVDQIAERAKILAEQKAAQQQGGMDFDFGDVDTRARVTAAVQKHFQGLITAGKGLARKIAQGYYDVTGEQLGKADLAKQVGEVIARSAHTTTPLGYRISEAVKRIAEGAPEDAETTRLVKELETGNIIEQTLRQGRSADTSGLGGHSSAHDSVQQPLGEGQGEGSGARTDAPRETPPPDVIPYSQRGPTVAPEIANRPGWKLDPPSYGGVLAEHEGGIYAVSIYEGNHAELMTKQKDKTSTSSSWEAARNSFEGKPEDVMAEAERRTAYHLKQKQGDSGKLFTGFDPTGGRFDTAKPLIDVPELLDKAKRRPIPKPKVDPYAQEIRDLRDYLASGQVKTPYAKAQVEKRITELERQQASARAPSPPGLKQSSPKAALSQATPPATRQIPQPDKLKTKTSDIIRDVLSVPQSVMASGDLSGTLRQGLLLTARRPGLAAHAFGDQIRAMFSEEAYRSIDKGIREGLNADLHEQYGLYLPKPDGPIAGREEAFRSRLAERIPVLGKIVRASDRAYVTYLNKMRAGSFDAVADALYRNGKTPENNPKAYKDLAGLMNAASGRGNLGMFEKYANDLSAVLWSPRLIASRVQLLNPMYYARLEPSIRAEAVKTMASTVAATVAVLGMAKMAGADVETDMRSTDFGQIKIGNTRIDILGGFRPYFVAMARFATGETKSGNGQITNVGEWKNGKPPATPDRTQPLTRLMEGKLNPTTAYAYHYLRGTDFKGDAFDPGAALVQMLVPMPAADIAGAVKEHGAAAGGLMGATSLLGAGVSTYGPNSKKADSGPLYR